METSLLSRILLVSAILLAACRGAWAQEGGAGEDEVTAKLSTQERERVAEVTARAQREARVAQAELDIVKAQLNRLLLSLDADMKEVEKLLRQALEWELQLRLAEVRRELEIRKIVGDRRWAELVQTWKRQGEAGGAALAQKVDAAIDRLVDQIVALKLDRANRDEVEKRLRNLLKQLVQGSSQAEPVRERAR